MVTASQCNEIEVTVEEADGSYCAERPVGERKANVGELDFGYVERASRTLADGAGEAWRSKGR
jgi:hypothetical protein